MKPVFTGPFADEWDTLTDVGRKAAATRVPGETLREAGERVHRALEEVLREDEGSQEAMARYAEADARWTYQSLELRVLAAMLDPHSPLARRKRGRGLGARKRRAREARALHGLTATERLRAKWFATYPAALDMFDSPTGRTPRRPVIRQMEHGRKR